MTGNFDYFVVFAEMRTGSNFLETNLNALQGVTCHGEAFNPHFIGYPKQDDILGVTKAERDSDPAKLVSAIRDKTDGLGGFRFFHDHDPRVLEPILADSRCAKIVLTRNPAESYVSWKIAKQTGQWKLTDVKRRKSGKAMFDAEEFAAHIGALQAFQIELLSSLQRSGQTAFYVAYEDLQDLAVMNGLATFLGVPDRLEALDETLKVQNPAPLSEKVANYPAMEAALAGVDRFNLTRTPNFEPRRSAAVPTYMAAVDVPLVFLPIKGGPVAEVEAWLAALGEGGVDALLKGMNQKNLRQWKRTHPGHRSFTVIRHPLERAHHVFCEKILSTGPDAYPQIRKSLEDQYDLDLPPSEDAPWDKIRHRAAFAGFLRFLKANLTGQTAIRVDATWCSQSQVVQGFGAFMLPDFIFREPDLPTDLPALADRVGAGAKPFDAAGSQTPIALVDIYDDEIEALTRAAYQRDYMMFGFENWA
ncbi:nodulation protein NodH [Aliishimia ponticola]|uniref:Nodulation protein NodH n=1 Tax=Aliishimia ponticola TaxID=2499833 RepID=A0A4S4N6E7_9RHOB|nr:nodulation protein NodH [Aliishimia ponticola]THH34702.1 nodulation protein NodH [Aliishimia ponticola]